MLNVFLGRCYRDAGLRVDYGRHCYVIGGQSGPCYTELWFTVRCGAGSGAGAGAGEVVRILYSLCHLF